MAKPIKETPVLEEKARVEANYRELLSKATF
jgi:hypothetical protein